MRYSVQEKSEDDKKKGTYVLTSFLTTAPSFALNRGIMFLSMMNLRFGFGVNG